MPLVFYQGAEPWRYGREFSELITDAVPQGRWLPRFEHLLIDQTKQGADTASGAVGARLAQVAMMATFRKSREGLLEQATRLMAELYRAAGFEEVAKHVEYVLAAQSRKRREAFVEALRRNVPGRGGDVMNYVERLIERGRREGPSGRCTDDAGANHRGTLGTRCPVVHHRSGHRYRRGHVPAAQAATSRPLTTAPTTPTEPHPHSAPDSRSTHTESRSPAPFRLRTASG